MSTVLVAGGYGVFGLRVAQELARLGVEVTVAGRDRAKAEQAARQMGAGHRGISLDINDPSACLSALSGHRLVVNCAGPFSSLSVALPEACLQIGCHYVDIADDRGYVSLLRSLGPRFEKKNLTAAFGCSSLPGISGALAQAMNEEGIIPQEIRVTLFIGNRNPKGNGAIHSIFKILGRPILAPQGEILGFADSEKVQLPAPWGERCVYNFESPEYDLFPEQFGARSVRVKVGFELRAVNWGFAALAKLPKFFRQAMEFPLSRFSNVLSRLGSSGGAVQVELFFADRPMKRGTLFAPRDGQLIAALPCVAVSKALLSRWEPQWGGAKTAYELLGAKALLSFLTEEGRIRESFF